MAISTDNIFLKGLSGAIGKQLVVKKYGDKIVVSKYPYMDDRKLSPKQLEANELMREANIYAKAITKNPINKEEAVLRLKVAHNKVYRALIKEYMMKKGKI